MGVSSSGLCGTIGGGQLEFDAIAAARSFLDGDDCIASRSVALGPEIGQCCGGRVEMEIRRLDGPFLGALQKAARAIISRQPQVFIYGAGHVGRALAVALAPLPLTVSLIDGRTDELARLEGLPHVRRMDMSDADRSATSVAAAAPPLAAHVVMTHSHALDSLIAATVLERADFGYLGLIGSGSKKALFFKAFRETGVPEAVLARVRCPIGGTDIRDKRPAVIAALTAAEIIRALWTQEQDAPMA